MADKPRNYDSGLKPLLDSERPAFKRAFREYKQKARGTSGVGPVEEFRQTDMGAEMPERAARQRVRESFREDLYVPPKKQMKFKRKR